jgi:hypothetical protein
LGYQKFFEHSALRDFQSNTLNTIGLEVWLLLSHKKNNPKQQKNTKIIVDLNLRG